MLHNYLSLASVIMLTSPPVFILEDTYNECLTITKPTKRYVQLNDLVRLYAQVRGVKALHTLMLQIHHLKSKKLPGLHMKCSLATQVTSRSSRVYSQDVARPQ